MPANHTEFTPESPSNTASARAISKEPSLSIKPDDAAVAVRLGMRAPKPDSSNAALNTTLARGISDAIAVVATHHNEEIHQLYKPHTSPASQLFNEMERLRCESVGTANRLGTVSYTHLTLPTIYSV